MLELSSDKVKNSWNLLEKNQQVVNSIDQSMYKNMYQGEGVRMGHIMPRIGHPEFDAPSGTSYPVWDVLF